MRSWSSFESGKVMSAQLLDHRNDQRTATIPLVLADLGHLPRIHATTIDLEPRQACLYLAQILRREFDVDRAVVLTKVIHVARARNRDNPRLLRHQPRKDDLGGRCTLIGAERFQKFDDRLV